MKKGDGYTEINEKNNRVVFANNDGWHLAIIGKKRIPSFLEVKRARNKYIPRNIPMAMIFPQEKDYINIHPRCLHLFEVYPIKR